VTTESETETVTSKKIRIYPEDEILWEQALNIYRRAYNLTIELFKPKVCALLNLTIEGQKPSSKLRSRVVEWCKYEADYNGVGYDVNLLQAAYKKACDTRLAIIKKRKRKQKADYSFMSRNATSQYFIAPRLSKGKKIFPRFLKDFHWSEPCPDFAISKTVVIKRENGQWFANVQSIITTQKSKAENLKIVALDPGVRTFQTAFNDVDSVDYGLGFVSDKLMPLMLELDNLLSQRDQLRNKDQPQQWVNDRLKANWKKINKIKARQKNLVEDLHRRVAYDLVTHYHLILLPTFETK
jgi:putative transposase